MQDHSDFRIHLAAIYTNNYKPGQSLWDRMNPHEQEQFQNISWELESYHYINKGKYVRQMREDGAKVFLDSGAFSAYTLGKEVDLGAYVAFIKQNKDIIREEDGILLAAVLDSIGDDLGTWQNQKKMEMMGVKPVPCFHYGEDERYLEFYANNYEYISLGGLVGAPTRVLIKWLDRMWNDHLVDGSGNAKLKVHGFGVTSIPIMNRYPWRSCDSSSWVQNTSFGAIMTEKYGTINISEKSPSRHNKGQHIRNMSEIERELLTTYIEQKGFELERLETHYPSRAAFNVMAYEEIGKTIRCDRLENINVTAL